jgi:hypothetical protein
MSDDLYDGMIGLHQASSPHCLLKGKLPTTVDFKTRSKWRQHSRHEADQVPLDNVLACHIDLRRIDGETPGVDLHLTAGFPPGASHWLYTTHEMVALRKSAGWCTDLHLEVLPTRRFPGYLFRLSRRLYPPNSQQGDELGELGHAFFHVTSRSFEKCPKLRSRSFTLSRHQTFIELVKEVDELVFHLDGEPLFISGCFCSGKLTKVRSPRKTFVESRHVSSLDMSGTIDILEGMQSGR